MPQDGFPVGSLDDALPHLRRPFAPEAVKFKVQSTFGAKANPTGGRVVSYIDRRLAIERLNLVAGANWSAGYGTPERGPLANALFCHLTVFGQTRVDMGEGYEGKGLLSDALKRAAVHFGVGVSLYALPEMRLYVEAPDPALRLKAVKDKLYLTDDNERHLRDAYSGWLKDHGVKAFGEPLDHGDVEGAVGDVEAQDAPSAGSAAPEPAPEYEIAADDPRVAEAAGLYDPNVGYGAKGEKWPPSQFSEYLKVARTGDERMQGLLNLLKAKRAAAGDEVKA